ncbi:MAG: GNAT family N-acetyltransferase [Pseudolabrys sp.]
MLVHIALAEHGIVLRLATDDDRAFQRALFETARTDAALLAAWPEAARKPFLDQQFHFQTAHYARAYPDVDWLIVVADDKPIGRLILARAPEEWCVVDIALMPDRRGTGLGTRLLQSVQSAAAQARASTVQLTVDMHNPARRLYERLGFAAVNEAIPNVFMAWPVPNAQLKIA